MNFYLNANDMMDLSHSLLMAPEKLGNGFAGVLFRRVTYDERVSVWYPKVNNSHIMATHFLIPFAHLFSHIKNIDHLALITLPAKHLKPFVTCEACFCGVHLSLNVWWDLCYSLYAIVVDIVCTSLIYYCCIVEHGVYYYTDE